MSGYTECGCATCFQIAIGDDSAELTLCLACKEAGCDGGECQCVSEPDGPFVSEDVYATVGADTMAKKQNLPQFTSVGSYTVVYYTRSHDPVCAACASKWDQEHDPIVIAGPYWEGAPQECVNCDYVIESSYGDPNEGKESES